MVDRKIFLFETLGIENMEGTELERVVPDLHPLISHFAPSDLPGLKPQQKYRPISYIGDSESLEDRERKVGYLDKPQAALAIDFDGNIFLGGIDPADRSQGFNHKPPQILHFHPNGTFQKAFGPSPKALIIDWRGDLVAVDEHANDVKVFNRALGYLFKRKFGRSASSWDCYARHNVEDFEDDTLKGPTDVAIDFYGNYLVVDSLNRRIQIYDRQGKWLDTFKTNGLPTLVSVGLDGVIHVVVDEEIELFDGRTGQWIRSLDWRAIPWLANPYRNNLRGLTISRGTQYVITCSSPTKPGVLAWEAGQVLILEYDLESKKWKQVSQIEDTPMENTRTPVIDWQGNILILDSYNRIAVFG